MKERFSDLPRNLKIGVILAVMAGLFPGLIGLYFYFMFFHDVNNPDQIWTAGIFTDSKYTLNQLVDCAMGCDLEIHTADFLLAMLIALTNVVNTGVLVVSLAWYGLRHRKKGAWLSLLFIFIWVPLNETLGMLHVGAPPVAFYGEVVGLTGLAFAWHAIFRGQPSQGSEVDA
ncbi:MAG: hypothetical protein GY719_15865 [bacterium]|nr:hypothetical protein [bacterium]